MPCVSLNFVNEFDRSRVVFVLKFSPELKGRLPRGGGLLQDCASFRKRMIGGCFPPACILKYRLCILGAAYDASKQNKKS